MPQIFLCNVVAEAGRIFCYEPQYLHWQFTRKLAKLLLLLHILARIRSIMCKIIIVQYCHMQYNVLFSHIKNCVLKIISDALFKFKSKDKCERKMLNRLKRNFKRKININSFWLLSQVLLLVGTGRWINDKSMKQIKSYLKMWRYRISPTRWYRTWNQSFFHCHVNEE